MRTILTACSVVACFMLSSCGGNQVQVVNATTKYPVSGAAVYGKTQGVLTAPYYTDANGFAPQPVGTHIEVRRSGYVTTTVPNNP